MSEQIAIEKIVRDGGTQSRITLHLPAVADYSEAMREGVDFPPITIYYDGDRYWLADGFHRVAAAEHAGLKHILANIYQGTQRDAVLFSVGANAQHGLRRTREDARRAVRVLLKDPEWSQWSDREIGRRANVDHKTVAALREQMIASGEIPQITERQAERGGTTFIQNTGNIGASRAAESPVDKYPNGCYVFHPNRKSVARVVDRDAKLECVWVVEWNPQSPTLRQGWQVSTIQPATPEQVNQWQHPPFPIGAQVLVDNSPIVGEVTGYLIGEVQVRRPNPNNPDVRMTHWIGNDRVRLATEQSAPEPPPAAAESLPEADDWLTRAMQEEDEQLADLVESDEQRENEQAQDDPMPFYFPWRVERYSEVAPLWVIKDARGFSIANVFDRGHGEEMAKLIVESVTETAEIYSIIGDEG